MRTSILTTSVIAIASLGVGSVTLTAAPATAAPSEVTRAEVLAVTAAVRAESPTATPGAYSIGTLRAIQALAGRVCSIEQAPGQYVSGVQASATEPGQSADGLVVHANIRNGRDAVHVCSFGAVAATAGSSALHGSALLGPIPAVLAGEVTVTPPVYADYGNPGELPAFQATGQSIQTLTTVTSTKVATPKSAKAKKHAKTKYAQRIKAAKKSYAKALKRAGHSKTKKQTAKRSYVRKRAAATASYQKSIATYKIVKRTSVSTTSRSFNLTARD